MDTLGPLIPGVVGAGAFDVVIPSGVGELVLMSNRYTAVAQRDGKWFIALCCEGREADSQGQTRKACMIKYRLI